MSKSLIFILLLGFIAVASAGKKSKTICQLTREKASQSKNPDLLVPECDKNGEFKPKQCHKKTGLCVCFNKDGEPVNKPSKNLQGCECVTKRAAALAINVPGAWGPQCDDNGLYRNKQCEDSGMCHCANPKTGEKIGESVRGPLNC